jgi:tripartite-type tricarboxylate transporter receptor subunit TctC
MQRQLYLAAALAAALLGSNAALAQDYPTHPVRFFVGFPPGGSSDILARALAQGLTTATGQSFIVENRPGANSLIATEDLIKSVPDGYTLQMTHSSHVTNPLFYAMRPYDAVNDITPIATIARSPFVLLENPSLGVKSLPELIALAKAKPGQLNYGSPGFGSMQQLSQELLLMRTGTKMTHVPYKGGGPAMTDLLAGHIPMLFSTTVQAFPFIKQKQVIALAVTSPKRLKQLPDVPAIAETLPGFSSDLWHGVIGPKGMPPAVVAKLRAELTRIVESPDMSQRLDSQGADPLITSPAEFKKLLVDENTKWTRVLHDANLKGNLQ